ncbi:UvrD-helicase domain-containing protein [Parvibaculum sp.]|uniref:UvrD-helicase domain-containing protein n=1 Tax=Parvibaculum sp. TaxID=2024848 RepID=UPI003BAADEF3
MSDERVAQILRSDAPLVAIEAAAGCGKTHQGADYARDWSNVSQAGRILILTHTHAACDVFSARTQGVKSKVEITTIDGLIAQIARAYHSSLGIPLDAARWAALQRPDGYDQLAEKVSAYVERHPVIAASLSRQYPTIVCDEHQDCTESRHRLIMAIHRQGTRLRIFADPMQRIYGDRSSNAVTADLDRWANLKSQGATDVLDTPHRWVTQGVGDLGEWVVRARRTLHEGGQIDLTRDRPDEVSVIAASNIAEARRQLRVRDRGPIDAVVNVRDPLMVLAPTNDGGAAMRTFWNRTLPIWEGHQRPALTDLVDSLDDNTDDAHAIGEAVVRFLQSVGVGFADRSHADRFRAEIAENCATAPRGPKPRNLQSLARIICENPNHLGVAGALRALRTLVRENAAGFETVKIDMINEYSEAERLDAFADFDTAHEELARRRTRSRRVPPRKCISTIHKAKGLECDHVMLVVNRVNDLSGTLYSRNRLYVGLSRARRSLTIVVPDVADTAVLKIR